MSTILHAWAKPRRVPRPAVLASKATVGEALDWGRNRLKSHRCVGADGWRDTELLLAMTLRKDRAFLVTHPESRLTKVQATRFSRLIERRRGHEPLDYIIGETFFRDRAFHVTSATLIPRWASETIVDTAIIAATRMPDAALADIGTGSGCLGLTLVAELPGRDVTLVDVSGAALAVARRNAKRHELTARVTFRKGDLLAPLLKDLPKDRAAVIIANLPYLPKSVIAGLPPEIRRHEPRLALDGLGRDGLKLFRRMFSQLRASGRTAPTVIVCECLSEQVEPLAKEARETFIGAATKTIVNPNGVTIGVEVTVRGGGA